jgi:hypothetical protein
LKGKKQKSLLPPCLSLLSSFLFFPPFPNKPKPPLPPPPKRKPHAQKFGEAP